MKPAEEDLARLVSYVFSATGRRRISEEDWVRILSLERKWFTPTKARLAADAARAAGFLRNAGARDYEKGLEAEGWNLPFDYRPDLARVEAHIGGAHAGRAAGLPLFRRIVRAISERTGEGEAAIAAKINQSSLSGHGLVRAEVAALAHARLLGVEIEPFLDEVDGTLQVPASR